MDTSKDIREKLIEKITEFIDDERYSIELAGSIILLFKEYIKSSKKKNKTRVSGCRHSSPEYYHNQALNNLLEGLEKENL